MTKKRVLVTGAAGFIGYHTCAALTKQEHVEFVVGVDALVYPKEYEHAQRERLYKLKELPRFFFQQASITNIQEMKRIFDTFRPTHVVHLAAYSSVVESKKRFYQYTSTNVLGFQIIAGLCLRRKIERLVFASSAAAKTNGEPPINIYASNKIANEHDANIFANETTGMTGLRFFNVYGPYCRPDSAIYKFATQIKNGEIIKLYNHGKNLRDFIYIDDVVGAIVSALESKEQGYECYEIGTGRGCETGFLLPKLGKVMGIGAVQMGLDKREEEVIVSIANTQNTLNGLNFWKAKIDLDEGLRRFVDWFDGVKT